MVKTERVVFAEKGRKTMVFSWEFRLFAAFKPVA
jgi:hypothetical protein